MNWWKKFRKGLFTKSQVLTGVTLSLLMTSALVWAFQFVSLNVFSPGQIISSSEVNNNFNYLNERLNHMMGDKFVVKTSSALGFTSVACCAASNQFVSFDTIEVDASGKGSQFIANGGSIPINESGFYEITFEGQVDAGSVQDYGYIDAQVYDGTTTSVLFGLYLDTFNAKLKGTRQVKWIKSGVDLEVVGRATCCNANLSDTIEVPAGLTFSLKKL